jgi:signal transduction histidine kinase
VSIDVAPGIQMDSYPVSMGQVVTNLAINSLQHAFEPGRSGRIMVRAALREDDEVRIEFSDDGCGIDTALRGRVFEPFFTTRRMIGGSGLGLYIVNRIVTRQLDGTIELQGDAGQGARFVMQFPRVARHSPNIGHILAALPRTSVDEP